MHRFGLSLLLLLPACGETPDASSPSSKPAAPVADASTATKARPGPMMVRSKPVEQKPVSKKVAWTTVDTAKDVPADVTATAGSVKGVPVVYVGATWCGPCKVYKNSLEDPAMIRAHLPVHIIELDADKHPNTLQALKITPSGIPLGNGGPLGHHHGRKIDGSAWQDNTVKTWRRAHRSSLGADTGNNVDQQSIWRPQLSVCMKLAARCPRADASARSVYSTSSTASSSSISTRPSHRFPAEGMRHGSLVVERKTQGGVPAG